MIYSSHIICRVDHFPQNNFLTHMKLYILYIIMKFQPFSGTTCARIGFYFICSTCLWLFGLADYFDTNLAWQIVGQGCGNYGGRRL